MHYFLKFIFGIKLYMFRTVPMSIIRNFTLYKQQCVCWQLASKARTEPSWSCSQAVSKPVWHIALLCVQWKTSDEGQRNCPKHVEFYSKNKFEKLVHLVGFIVRIWWYLCYALTLRSYQTSLIWSAPIQHNYFARISQLTLIVLSLFCRNCQIPYKRRI